MKAQEFLNEATQDTGWRYTKTAKPDRGFHDHERYIQFKRRLTDGEVFALQTYFDLDKESKTPYHYGGLVVRLANVDEALGRYDYLFECSCDSS